MVGYNWIAGVFAFLTSVEPGEVLQVLEGTGRRWPRPAVGVHGVPLLAILGRTGAGRPITVYIHRSRPGGFDWDIVAARPMTANELAAYEAWEGKP